MKGFVTAMIGPLNWILLIFGVSLLLLAVRRLRQYRLKERYALLFCFIGLPFLFLALRPRTIQWFSEQLNINYHTITLLCVTMFLILLIFELLTIISQQDRKITTLAQMVGILMEKQNLIEQRHVARHPEDAEEVLGGQRAADLAEWTAAGGKDGEQ